MKRLLLCLLWLLLPFGAAANDLLFNGYILKAVESIAKDRSRLGYALSSYTRDIKVGGFNLKATNPPFTMCVAAQLEIIAEALSIYEKETGDKSFYDYLPLNQWRSLSPYSFRGQLWLVKDSPSLGTAYALENFGMGTQLSFDQLKPGGFLNLNRKNSGHAVVFLYYIDRSGRRLSEYSPSVAGFFYFSAQGNESDGGFDYRYAFFEDSGCPVLGSGKRRDCGVIRTTNSKYLNAGHMYSPKHWNTERRNRAVAVFDATKDIVGDADFDSSYYNGKTTD